MSIAPEHEGFEVGSSLKEGQPPDRSREARLENQLVARAWGRNGRVAGLFETPAPGCHLARSSVTVLTGKGFAGDHDRKSYYRGAYVPGREVSAVSAEVLAGLGVEAAVVGDNLITEGIDLRALEPGARMALGREVLLARSSRTHRPCRPFRERTSEAAYEAARRGWRGALFVVLRGGTLRLDDPIRLI